MTAKTGKFKEKGINILKNRQPPNSMKNFLEDMPAVKSEQNSSVHDAESHNSAYTNPQSPPDTQILKDTSHQNHHHTCGHNLERLHLHIRKDLADRLCETVFNRKRESISKGEKRNKATQRAIIEEALSEYFVKHGL
jgi:hypothetical protein